MIKTQECEKELSFFLPPHQSEGRADHGSQLQLRRLARSVPFRDRRRAVSPAPEMLLFFAFAAQQPGKQQNAGQCLAIQNRAFFDHLDNFRKFH